MAPSHPASWCPAIGNKRNWDKKEKGLVWISRAYAGTGHPWPNHVQADSSSLWTGDKDLSTATSRANWNIVIVACIVHGKTRYERICLSEYTY